ncbi:replication protein A 70 kDa DNA-binding subunit B-like isoform X2 [Castanea sativa]|uniref:replication protein A 70 kDa DNA-binding subunit B-like isoform X2 n=1 Tax=Castanea sativa TaxID=21020 RepID=UPI003F6509FA
MIYEVILIDQLLKSIILTMWDQFVTNESAAIAQMITTRPVIMAIRLKVVSHDGLSLSTRSSSSFIIDPRIPEATALQTWATEKK